ADREVPTVLELAPSFLLEYAAQLNNRRFFENLIIDASILRAFGHRSFDSAGLFRESQCTKRCERRRKLDRDDGVYSRWYSCCASPFYEPDAGWEFSKRHVHRSELQRDRHR